MKDIGYNNASFSRWVTLSPEPNQFQRHCHDGYELYVFLSGNAELAIDQSLYELLPYSMVLIGPMQYHVLNLKSNKPYERVVLNFPEDFVNTDYICKSTPQFFLLSESSDIIRDMLRLEKTAEEYSVEDRETAFHSIVTDIILRVKYMIKNKSGEQPLFKSTVPLIEKAVTFINDNLCSAMNIETIAAALYISPSQLCHCFQAHLKISLMQYVRQKKILYARALIKSGTKPTHAAEICGYKAYSSFLRNYQKLFSCNPKQEK